MWNKGGIRTYEHETSNSIGLPARSQSDLRVPPLASVLSGNSILINNGMICNSLPRKFFLLWDLFRAENFFSFRVCDSFFILGSFQMRPLWNEKFYIGGTKERSSCYLLIGIKRKNKHKQAMDKLALFVAKGDHRWTMWETTRLDVWFIWGDLKPFYPIDVIFAKL